MTATDVKFSMDKAINTPVHMSRLDFLSEVKIIDDYTVQFLMEKPYAPILTTFASSSSYIVNKKAGKEEDFTIGTGAFKLHE